MRFAPVAFHAATPEFEIGTFTVYVVALSSAGTCTWPKVALNAGVICTDAAELPFSHATPSFTSAICSWYGPGVLGVTICAVSWREPPAGMSPPSGRRAPPPQTAGPAVSGQVELKFTLRMPAPVHRSVP